MADHVRVVSDSAGGEAVPPGLVSFSTSDKTPETLGLQADGPHQVIIDSNLGRLRRMRSALLALVTKIPISHSRPLRIARQMTGAMSSGLPLGLSCVPIGALVDLPEMDFGRMARPLSGVAPPEVQGLDGSARGGGVWGS